MATKGKAPHSGSGKKKTGEAFDPLNKWSNDPSDVAQESVDAAAAFQKEIVVISRQMASPGLNLATRRALYAALAEAKKGLKDAKEDTAKMMALFKQKGNLHEEASMKLKDVQALLKGNKDPYVAQYAKVTQDLLKQLIESSKNLGKSEIETAGVMSDLEKVKASMENLPEEFSKRLEETTELFNTLNKQQEQQRAKWSADNKRAQDLLDDRAKELKEWRHNLGMGIADKIGIGGFNVGNAIRGYKSVKGFVNKHRELSAAKKLVRMTNPKLAGVGEGMKEDNKAENEKELVELVKEYVNDNKKFNHKVVDGIGKKKSGGGDSGLGGLAAAITAGLGTFFSGSGLTSLLGSIAGKIPLGQVASSLARVAGPAALVAGAGYAGWQVGTKIYEKYGDEIQTGIGKIDDFVSHLFGRQSVNDINAAATAPTPFTPKGGTTRGLGGGGGRGSVNPPMVTPDDSPSVVSTGGQVSESTGTGTSMPDTGVGGGRGRVNPANVDPNSVQLNSGANVKGLNPSVKANLMGMATEYQQLTGKKLPINSAFRSIDEQAKLYKTKPKGMAAAPGSSLHNFGFAVDTNSGVGGELQKNGLLAKYGFERPISKEPWHMQPAGMTLAAARSGLYSGDAPADQGGPGESAARAAPAAQAVTAAVSPGDTGNVSGPGGGGAGGGSGKGSMGVPSQSSVKDIPTFDQSDGMFLAMNLGVC